LLGTINGSIFVKGYFIEAKDIAQKERNEKENTTTLSSIKQCKAFFEI